MNDDELKNKTVVVDETVTDLEDVRMFGGYDEDYGPSAPEPTDDTGKTTEQILAECGVTRGELEEVFPSGYEPLKAKPSEMKMEDLLQRAREATERLRVNAQAKNEQSAKMPNNESVNLKYAETAPEKFKITEDGPLFTLEGFLALLDKSKEEANRAHSQVTAEQVKQSVLGEVKRTLEDIVESSELETFDAQTARRIYLNKIKAHSKLKDLLKTLRRAAAQGKPEEEFTILSRYDKIKLAELGFTVKNTSNGGQLSYVVSWDDGMKR